MTKLSATFPEVTDRMIIQHRGLDIVRYRIAYDEQMFTETKRGDKGPP